MYTWRIYSNPCSLIAVQDEDGWYWKLHWFIYNCKMGEKCSWSSIDTLELIELQLYEKLSLWDLNLWNVIPLFALCLIPYSVNWYHHWLLIFSNCWRNNWMLIWQFRSFDDKTGIRSSIFADSVISQMHNHAYLRDSILCSISVDCDPTSYMWMWYVIKKHLCHNMW